MSRTNQTLENDRTCPLSPLQTKQYKTYRLACPHRVVRLPQSRWRCRGCHQWSTSAICGIHRAGNEIKLQLSGWFSHPISKWNRGWYWDSWWVGFLGLLHCFENWTRKAQNWSTTMSNDCSSVSMVETKKLQHRHTVSVMWILLFATPIGLISKLGAFALANRHTRGNHKAIQSLA